MSPHALLTLSTVVAVVALLAAAGWWRHDPLALRDVVDQLHRPPVTSVAGPLERLGASVARVGALRRLVPAETDAKLTGTTSAAHVGTLMVAAVAGGLVPSLVTTAGTAAGVLAPSWTLPTVAALAGAAAVPMAVHVVHRDRVRAVRTDLRHQLSAYLDVVTMLLAGNSGHEGALAQAADAGDGRLFVELRKRAREAAAAGDSLVVALAAVADDLGLVELEHVAATTTLSATEGAPVARTLAAACATLRASLASEQEAEARLRTSRLSTPLVGMALVFMALVIYPALQLT